MTIEQQIQKAYQDFSDAVDAIKATMPDGYSFNATATVQPVAVIDQFADDLGYQTVKANPDYVPAEYDLETMEETKPAEGEQIIPNDQTREDFIAEKHREFTVEQFFGQFARRNAERLKAEEAKELTKQTVAAIKATIVTK